MSQTQKIPARKSASGTGGLWILLCYITLTNGLTYKQPIMWDQDLSSFFGPDGCITGVLTAMASQPGVVPPIQDNTVTTCGAGSDECPLTADTTHEKEHQGSGDLANHKEKTPMCLVNELARFNKIVHQYRLTGEQGPPHQKKFMVTLKLGDEEYSAEGASIKKAQHAAASYALRVTNYEHPPPKASKNSRSSNITPTVELNALAMRRGEPTTYTMLEPSIHHQNFNYHHRGMYTQPRTFSTYQDVPRRNIQTRLNNTNSQRYDNQRSYGMKNGAVYRVSVKVGDREFQGEGSTAQAARHDAASKALEELRNLPVDANNKTAYAYIVEGGGLETDSSSDLKSPISLVHEVALKRNLTVSFEVIDEKGPPHMRTFVTRCRVGDTFETTGEGNGKKISKKRAAERMLEELRSLPPTTVVNASGFTGPLSRMKRKPNAAKKKSRNLIKETNANIAQEKTDTEIVIEEINPISRLIQIQQAKKEKEPVYTLKEERGQARRREFLMEVSVGEYSYVGSGPNKKLAKRNAAKGLLQEMGYSAPSEVRKQANFMNGDKATINVGGSGGRQLVPGLLLMTDNLRSSSSSSTSSNGNTQNKGIPGNNANLQATVKLVKDYLNGGSMSHSNEVRGNHISGGSSSSHAVRPKDQLLYLAKLLGFKVQFSDFPKGNHSEFLSLVSLSTEPPQVCHGSGKTTENSHDQAALTALRALAEMGLDSVTPSLKKENSIGPGGDHQQFMSSSSSSMAGKASFINGASGK